MPSNDGQDSTVLLPPYTQDTDDDVGPFLKN